MPPVVSGSLDHHTIISQFWMQSTNPSVCSAMPSRALCPHVWIAPQCQPSQLSGLWSTMDAPMVFMKRGNRECR